MERHLGEVLPLRQGEYKVARITYLRKLQLPITHVLCDHLSIYILHKRTAKIFKVPECQLSPKVA